LSLYINASAATSKNLHFVQLKASNGMTGAQACQQYWPNALTCIPTQNNSNQDLTLSSPSVSSQAELTPGDVVAIINPGTTIAQVLVTVKDQNGNPILNNKFELNDQGDT
jgi:hypothetical protein